MESIALLILVLAIHMMVINLSISKHGKLAREMVVSKNNPTKICDIFAVPVLGCFV